MKSRKGFWQKVPYELRQRIDWWVRSHHYVIHSPIAKDTLKVPDQLIKGKFIRKLKLILQCSVRELHGDLYKPDIGLGDNVLDDNKKPLVSDTMFRMLLPISSLCDSQPDSKR